MDKETALTLWALLQGALDEAQEELENPTRSDLSQDYNWGYRDGLSDAADIIWPYTEG